MSLQDAFLADIIEHPDDDAPRLVFADWLEDNGDPERADFIRIQCELWRSGESAGSLAERERDLLHRHEGRWAEPLRRLGVQWWVFRRGFIEVAALQSDLFVLESARLFAAAPVRDVTLFDVHPLVDRLLGCADLGRLTALRLHGPVDAGRLLQARPWPRLRTLEVRAARHDWRITSAISGPVELPALVEVGLAAAGVTDAWLAALARSAVGGQLQALDLPDNRITDAGAVAVAATRLPRLRLLNLDGNPVGDSGVAALLDAPGLRNLVYLGCARTLATPPVLERAAERAESGRR